MERQPYRFSELFTGNWELFEKAVRSPETVFVYDIDGILANSPKVVLKRFTEKTGLATNPTEINEWNYLTNIAKKGGLGKEFIKDVETDWYEPDILKLSQKYLYITPAVEKTLKYYGPDRNFALTARDPVFKESTIDWFSRQVPEFKSENIFIRKDKKISSAVFKSGNLASLAKAAPWVVYVDDSIEFTKAALDADIKNCLVVNIPLGKIMPDFRHERQFIIKRYPDELQAVYPFMDALDRALRNGKSP
jgi:hypothetical protein